MSDYIALPDESTFQRHPAGATISKLLQAGAGMKDKFNKSVNMDGARLLELCNGQTRLGEIVARHNELYPANLLNAEKTKAFLNLARSEEMVCFSSEKTAPRVRFAGSYDHFYPQHSAIELTDQCNYKCAHCYRGSSPESGLHIDFEKAKEYVNSLWEHGGTVLELTGGEPMLYKHFFEMIEFAYPRMDLVAVLTNGYFLQEESVERLLKYKDKLMFNISMDSYRPEFHDKFRGKEGAHARTAKAMELLGRHGFTYRAAMSVTDGNFFDIEGTIKLAKRHGAKIFGMTPVLDTGRGDELCAGQKQKTDMDFARKCMEYEKYILGNYRDFIHLVTEAQALDVRKSNCGLIHRSVTVGPDGELRPCVMFGGGVIKIGNIYQQSFKEIFEGKLGAFFNRLHGPKPEVCGDCKHLPYCQNCPLKGVKMALKTPDCRWAAQTGVLQYVKDAPSHKVCGNAQEPYYG